MPIVFSGHQNKNISCSMWEGLNKIKIRPISVAIMN